MKKLLCVLLCCVLLLGSAALAACAETAEALLPADTVIVIPAAATLQETAAAEKLVELFRRGAFGEPAIITDDNEKTAFEIAIGNTNRFSADLTGKPDGSYVIKSYDGGVAIVGAGKRGVIYGVYGFMKEYADAKFLTLAGFYTDRTAVLMPQNADLSFTPTFEYTETDWRSPNSSEYSVANGLTGGIYRDIPEKYGGTVDYFWSFAHTLTNVFCCPWNFFDQHPEYYALHGGKRFPNQLCLTSEGAYQVVREGVFQALDELYDPQAPLQIISITQNDNNNYCECPNCKALDEANGSHAGTMITFVNRIADEVKAAGYDNVAIDTFAYQYTRTAPTQVVPRDNVIVRLCSIECCFSHTLDDPSCPDNVRFMADLRNWSRICNRLYIWDYTTNYAHTLGLFPNFGVLQRNMQIFAENGVKGVYEEGNYYIDSCDTEFGELRAYLISRLLRDPYCDYDAEMLAFCKEYYGAGADQIISFLRAVTDNAAKRHVHIWETMPDTLSFSAQEVRQMDALWSSVKQAADTQERLDRINRSELSWRFWKASVSAGEFAGKQEGKAARIQLHDDLIAAGTTKCNEAYSLMFNPQYMYMPATRWFDMSAVPDPDPQPATQPATQPSGNNNNNGGGSAAPNFWQQIVNWFRQLFATIAGWFKR